MSKFSITVFISYLLLLVTTWFIDKHLYWAIISTVLILQMINMVFRKYIDNKTKYHDSYYAEEEKLRFFYAYFGFPITLMFPKYFRQIRKDSYYERKLKEIETTMKFFEGHNVPIPEETKNEWTICNRYLKLKKLKTKQEEV